MTPPLVSIVVLNFNGRRWIRPLFRSLLAQTHTELDLVVVDNASRDDSLALLEREFPDPRIRILRQDRNGGFSAGNNAGIRAARGRYVLLLNNDVVLDARCVEELVRAAGGRGRFGVLAPKILWFYRPEYIESIGTMCTPDGTGFNHGIGHVDVGQFDVPERVFGACFAAAFFRREAFEEVGLLDESYFMYYEDVDWNFRANRRGLPVHTVPAARVYHVHSGSLRYAGAARKQYFLLRNRVRFGLLNMPGLGRQLLHCLKLVSPLRYWRLWLTPSEVAVRLRAAAHVGVRLPLLLAERRRRRRDPLAVVPEGEFLELYRGRESFFVSAELYPEPSARALVSTLRELFRAHPTAHNALRLGLWLATRHVVERQAPPPRVEAALGAWSAELDGLAHADELLRFACRISEVRAARDGRPRPKWLPPPNAEPEDPEPSPGAVLALTTCFTASGDRAALRGLAVVLASAHYRRRLRGAAGVDERAAEDALASAWQAAWEEIPAEAWRIPGAAEALEAAHRALASGSGVGSPSAARRMYAAEP